MQQLGHTFHFHATRMENPSKQCDVQPFQIEFLDAWAKQGPICLELQQCDILSRLTATGGGTFKKVSVSPNSFEFQATRIKNCSGSASDKESNKARPIKSLTQVAVGHPGAILDCNRRSSKAIPGDWHTRHGRPTGRRARVRDQNWQFIKLGPSSKSFHPVLSTTWLLTFWGHNRQGLSSMRNPHLRYLKLAIFPSAIVNRETAMLST